MHVHSRVAALTLIGALAVVGVGWLRSQVPQPDPASPGSQLEPSEAQPVEPTQIESGGSEALEPVAAVAPLPDATPSPGSAGQLTEPTLSVHDEGASRLPARALIPLILEEAKMLRGYAEKQASPRSREDAIASTEAELRRLMDDPKSNPSKQPLSETELAFASSTLADHDEFAATLRAQLAGQQDRAWERSVTLGLFAEHPPRLSGADFARLSQAEQSAQLEVGMASVEARHREMTSLWGPLWKDWTYTSIGGAGRSFDVYCTRADAPEVFSTSARITELRGQREQWVRTYLRDRRGLRPDYLPPR